MAARFVSAFLVLLALAGSISAITVNAPCGNHHGVSDFNFEAYSGTWYEMYRYPNELQLEAECMSSEMYVLDNEINMRMYNTMVFFDPEFRIHELPMTGKFAYPEASPLIGSFKVSSDNNYDETNYHILATDYENYALAWSCTDNDDNTSEQMAWVFSRYYYIPEEVQDHVQERVDEFFSRDLLRESFIDDHYCLGGEIEPAM